MRIFAAARPSPWGGSVLGDDANRDANALRIFNAIEFPEVSFYSQQLRLNKNDSIRIIGEFGLSGYKIAQSLDLAYTESDNEYRIEGEFIVDLGSTGIRLPRFLFKPIQSKIRCVIRLYFIKNFKSRYRNLERKRA